MALIVAVRTGLDLRSLMRLVRITLTRRDTGESIYAEKQEKPPEWMALIVAVRTGLEPVTPCVTGMYSNQTELTHRRGE